MSSSTKTAKLCISLLYYAGLFTSVISYQHIHAVGSMKYTDTTSNFKLNHHSFRDIPNTKTIRTFTFASNPMAGGYIEVNGQQVARYQVQKASAQKAPEVAGFVTIGYFDSAAQPAQSSYYYLIVPQQDFNALKQKLEATFVG